MRIFFLLLLLPVALAGVLVGAVYWERFYPSEVTPVVGPAGSKYRAFIEDRSFTDTSLIACASDWPYTLKQPFSLGCITFPEAYDKSDLLWSRDGTVLAFRVIPRGKKEEVYEAAYDFLKHTALHYQREKIGALMEARGGAVPAFGEIPDRKGLE